MVPGHAQIHVVSEVKMTPLAMDELVLGRVLVTRQMIGELLMEGLDLDEPIYIFSRRGRGVPNLHAYTLSGAVGRVLEMPDLPAPAASSLSVIPATPTQERH